jgi:uncharacterized protein
MSNLDPYHAGELEIQVLSDHAAEGEAIAYAIAKNIAPGAWRFLAAQSMLVLGSWDGERGVWPSVLFGPPGFVTTSDGGNVHLAVNNALVDHYDPIWQNLRKSRFISMLAIELTTRRRFRINGHLSTNADVMLAEGNLDVIVDQAYPNCPKYIQRRILQIDKTSSGQPDVREYRTLTTDQEILIANADTCFVASVYPASGTDISHRGGLPGFVRVESVTRLRIPDYAGNSMFNTLGNIHASGFAGLLFIDFESGRQLQIVGDARIDWMSISPDVERSWTLDIQHVRESSLPSGLKWKFDGFSPFNPISPKG